MRRLLAVSVVTAALLVGCSEQPTEAPSVPEPGNSVPLAAVGPAECTLNDLLTLTSQLFPPSPARNLILATLRLLPTRAQERLATIVKLAVLGIVDAVTRAYTAGNLAGGKSAQTQLNLLAFLNGLYCFVGMPQPNIPPGALDPNEGAIAVVTPTSNAMTVQPASKHGGLAIPARSVTATTLVAITFLPANSRPLLTSLDQYPLFYEFSTSPQVTFTKDVTAAVCLADNFTINGAVSLAHNVGPNFGNVQILPAPPPAAVLPVDCNNLPQVGALGGVRQFFASLFMPTPLNAATFALVRTAGVGGTTKNFSPFGVVDRLSNPGTLNVKDGVPTQSFVPPASPVTPSPAVVVTSNNGTPIQNVPVVFAASAGSTVGGGSSQTVITNASGVATAGPWIVGAAAQDYTLTATPPSLAQVGTVAPLTPAVAFNPTSRTFTATVVGPINYLSTGYRYLVVSEGTPPAGFTGLAFDDSTWPTGDAAFGFDGGQECSLISAAAGVKTNWQQNSQILVRKRFTVPGGGSSAVVSVAIDNDVKVFVNGADITSTARVNGESAVTLDGDGFARHEGCPTAGSLTFNATGLNPGVNLLVVQGRDRGGSTYLDVKVE